MISQLETPENQVQDKNQSLNTPVHFMLDSLCEIYLSPGPSSTDERYACAS